MSDWTCARCEKPIEPGQRVKFDGGGRRVHDSPSRCPNPAPEEFIRESAEVPYVYGGTHVEPDALAYMSTIDFILRENTRRLRDAVPTYGYNREADLVYFVAMDGLMTAVDKYRAAVAAPEHAHAAAEAELKYEAIALAAKAVVEAVECLPHSSKPVGWYGWKDGTKGSPIS